MLRIHPFLAVPVLAALAVSGCSNPAEVGESNTTPLASTDINPKTAADMQTAGELRLGVDKIGSLNPMAAEQSDDMADLRRAFMPTFFHIDDKGEAQPDTNYIESAVETASNPTAVTIKLSPRAVWGDGQRIKAEDVIATWNACNGKSQGFKCDPQLKFNQISQATQGASDNEVKLTFTKAYPQWRDVFTQVSVLRADSVKDADTFNNWAKLEKGWTSGPFQVDKVDLGKGYLQATPSAVWWGEKPMLERITIRQVKTADQPKAYADNEIDTLAIGASVANYNLAKTVPEYAFRKAGATTWRSLVVNTGSTGPVSDPAVRKAILLTLDRSAVGMGAYAGLEVKPAPQNHHFFLPGQTGYRDNVAAAELTRDVGKARKVLDDAGWKGDEKGRSKDGRALEVKLLQVQEVPTSVAEVTAIKQQLEAVGFKVSVVETSVQEYNSGTALAGGRFDLATMSTQGSPFVLLQAKNRYGSGAEENYSRFENPEVDQLLDQLATAPDAAGRTELANQLDRKLWEAAAEIPLYQTPEVVATKVRLAHYGAPGLASTRWEKVGYIR